jgi:hypothetical protein
MPESNDPIVKGRFHRVPKRYLSQLNREQRVSQRIVRKSGVISDRLDPSEIVGAAWDHLRSRFDSIRARSPDVYSKGRVRRAVVTYPTVLGPRARNEVVKLFHDMGVPVVKMLYDEAIAAAIFHLEKFFAGSYEVGPEAFKTRCRRQGETWVQNMLVLDIGGGTTDLAVIRLQMYQEPFGGPDQGAGGRYYTITPTLLGSSGNEFLGGELITLRTFRMLKFAIADYVLHYETAITYPPALAKARAAAIAKLDPKRQPYQPGALLELIAARNDDPKFKAALEAAEEILPTQFKTKPSALVAFQELWRLAEKLKVDLGRIRKVSPGKADLPISYTLDATQIASFLSTAWKGAEGAIRVKENAPSLTLDSELFERAAGPVVEQALKIAASLAESTLKKYEDDHHSATGQSTEKLDRIVLSGKSCNLHLVHELLPQVMRKCTYYGDDVTEVLFEPDLAKLATSVGACRAEEMWASLRPNDGWETTSGTGVSSVSFDIRNLFFFLPCSFATKEQDEQLSQEPLFVVNERFRMLDGSSMGKILSEGWRAPQPTTRVYRVDYKGDPGVNWGNYHLDLLAQGVDRSLDEVLDELRIRFEVNHETLVTVLLCRHGEPKYTFDDRARKVGEADIRPKLVEALRASGTTAAGDPLQGNDLRFDIAVDPVDDIPTVVLKAGSLFDHEAREPLPSLETEGANAAAPAKAQAGASQRSGVMFALSDPLPKPKASRTYDFYARASSNPNGRWTRLGTVSLPKGSIGFEENWHAAISQDGYIRVMQGLPDFWLARRPADLFDFAGTVLYENLKIEDRDPDPDINPDSGLH